MPEDVLGYKAYSISEYLAMPDIPQPYLVERLVFQNGKTVLVAKPKMGKSWLTLQLGLSVARGEPVLGLNTTRASVLILEFDRRYLVESIHEIAQGRDTDNMWIVPAQGVPLNKKEGLQFLASTVNRFAPALGAEGQLLVVIDHKSACFAGPENDDSPNRQWVQNLDIVAKGFPVSYLVVCQAPKGWRGDTVDLPFGSRILTAWADTVASLQKTSRDTRRLEMVSNYGEIEPFTYTKDFQIVEVEATEETKRERAMAMIEERWHKFRPPNISRRIEEVADTIGCGYKTVWDAYREVKKLMRGHGGKEEVVVDMPDASNDSERENDDR